MIIKEMRKVTGLSQAEFAKKYHIPIGTLAHWEQEIRKPPEYVIYMLSRIIYNERKSTTDRKSTLENRKNEND